MSLSLVVAMAENGVIGREGGLPWHLPRDLKEFKARTWGHTLVMGRKTWESIGRALPGRRSIVLTRQEGFLAEGGEVVGSLEEALALAAGEQVFVIGGAEVYRQALPLANRLFLTRVQGDVSGDVVFPELDWSQWRRFEEKSFPADERHAHAMSFEAYERVAYPEPSLPPT
ncbi:MAG: dihydrofolate reductase [Acidobacteria bacterium]|nr:dihydrofolate reductase [Acidobacteriota bacterium]